MKADNSTAVPLALRRIALLCVALMAVVVVASAFLRHLGATAALQAAWASELVLARQVAVDWVGEQGVIPNLLPLTGSEDFAFFLEQCKGSYLLLGNGVGQGAGEGGCMVHNPGYDFNDRCLGTGASYWVRLVQAFLQ